MKVVSHFLGSSILLQNLIPNIIEQLSGSFTDGTNLAELPLEGDGWIRATLPCHTTKDIDEALFTSPFSVYREWIEPEYVGRGKTMHMGTMGHRIEC